MDVTITPAMRRAIAREARRCREAEERAELMRAGLALLLMLLAFAFAGTVDANERALECYGRDYTVDVQWP